MKHMCWCSTECRVFPTNCYNSTSVLITGLPRLASFPLSPPCWLDLIIESPSPPLSSLLSQGKYWDTSRTTRLVCYIPAKLVCRTYPRSLYGLFYWYWALSALEAGINYWKFILIYKYQREVRTEQLLISIYASLIEQYEAKLSGNSRNDNWLFKITSRPSVRAVRVLEIKQINFNHPGECSQAWQGTKTEI